MVAVSFSPSLSISLKTFPLPNPVTTLTEFLFVPFIGAVGRMHELSDYNIINRTERRSEKDEIMLGSTKKRRDWKTAILTNENARLGRMSKVAPHT